MPTYEAGIVVGLAQRAFGRANVTDDAFARGRLKRRRHHLGERAHWDGDEGRVGTAYGLTELNKEKTFGGIGATKARAVPRIDMSDFEARKAAIADQLWNAATDIGFFQLVNHGIAQAQIDEAFAMTERFFALPHETKGTMPMLKGTNAGWEY